MQQRKRDACPVTREEMNLPAKHAKPETRNAKRGHHAEADETAEKRAAGGSGP